MTNLQHLADAGELVAYVGYGSLVNVKTHRTPSIGAVPVRLQGWGRQWCDYYSNEALGSPQKPALLTGVQREGTSIDALLVYDYASSLEALDVREALYHRVSLKPSDVVSSQPLINCPIYIYKARNLTPARPAHCYILQSYLDAVLQGYHVQFGAEAVEAFMQTTQNWGLPLRQDRATPIYPRPVQLSSAEVAYFDEIVENYTI